jgi:hypothetical protein
LSARFEQRALFIAVKTKRSKYRSMAGAGKTQENLFNKSPAAWWKLFLW